MSPVRSNSVRADRSAAFAAMAAASALVFAAAQIRSGLWQDETATWWVVKDGIPEAAARSWTWSGQSVLYYATAWLSKHLAPYTGLEISLRLPSLVCMAVAAWLLYRLGRRLAGTAVGAVAALAFLCLPEVAFAAIDARPYALALMLLLASTLFLVRWVDGGRARDAALYVATAALVVYAHYLFALALVPHAVYAARRARLLAGLWAAVGALCLPLAGQVLHFYQTRHAHSFALTPAPESYFTAIAPPALAGAVLLAIVLRRPKPDAPSPLPWNFLFAWLLVPTTLVFALSLFTDVKLFVPRYLLGCAPAAALLAAWAIVRCSAVRPAAAVLVLALGVRVLQTGPNHGGEDWRGAMRALAAEAKPGDKLLIATGFVEGAGAAMRDSYLHDALFAPQVVYPVPAFTGLPNKFDAAFIPGDLPSYPRVFLVTHRVTIGGYATGLEYEHYVEDKLAGFHARELGQATGISVIAFER
jgi:mannosyltransferase